MKRSFLTMAALFAGIYGAFSQSLPDMLIPSDPAAAAMGGMSVEAGAFAAQNNVSATAFAPDCVNVGLSASNWAPDARGPRSVNAGAALRFGRVGVAACAKGNFGHPYTTYNDNWQPEGEFNPLNLFAAAGAAVRISRNLALGLTGRFCSSSIAADCTAAAFCADVSATWQGRIFRVSASVCNIGTPVRYTDEGTAGRLPQMARFGANVHLLGCLDLGGEADILFDDGSPLFTAGAQYSLKDILFFRAGYHYGARTAAVPEYVTLGAAVSLWGVELGASWFTLSEVVGNSLVLSLSASF